MEWAWSTHPALIVVDSLSSITTRGENSIEDVRDVFAFLNRLALDYRCGTVIIHHLRKPGAQLPPAKTLTFHDLRGSSHISTMSRSVIGLHWVRTAPEPNMNDPRRMDVPNEPMPRSPLSRLNLEVRQGRGTAKIVEHPSAQNGYTTKIRVEDPARSGATYSLALSWRR